MSLVRAGDPLQLPETLQDQLHAFRKRVWSIKMIEAIAGAVFGVVVAYLLLFVLDRVWDTPVWARYALFIAAAVSCAMIPLAAHRWIWRNRRLEQLARLLARKHPGVGDQLLGIIELSGQRLRAGPLPHAVRSGDRAGCRRSAQTRLS